MSGVSTRKLVVAALLCAIVIPAAFAIQLLLAR
jgi:hypothetical protein